MRPIADDELKEKYFIQYYGQKVFGGICYSAVKEEQENFVQTSTKLTWQTFKIFHTIITGNLRLKPIDQLTDEQLIQIGRIYHNDEMYNASSIGSALITLLFDDDSGLNPIRVLSVFQYLIDEGFAVPFREYSIQELINLKWLILI